MYSCDSSPDSDDENICGKEKKKEKKLKKKKKKVSSFFLSLIHLLSPFWPCQGHGAAGANPAANPGAKSNSGSSGVA